MFTSPLQRAENTLAGRAGVEPIVATPREDNYGVRGPDLGQIMKVSGWELLNRVQRKTNRCGSLRSLLPSSAHRGGDGMCFKHGHISRVDR